MDLIFFFVQNIASNKHLITNNISTPSAAVECIPTRNMNQWQYCLEII